MDYCGSAVLKISIYFFKTTHYFNRLNYLEAHYGIILNKMSHFSPQYFCDIIFLIEHFFRNKNVVAPDSQ